MVKIYKINCDVCGKSFLPKDEDETICYDCQVDLVIESFYIDQIE